MDRKVFNCRFTSDWIPEWKCPTCGKDFLDIKEGSFIKEESFNSRKSSHGLGYYYNPYEDDYIYTCLLICRNKQCREIVASTGYGEFSKYDDMYYSEESGEWESEEYWDNFFQPQYFQPHLKIIQIPTGCPELVEKSLNESFKLFFSSPSSAANNVRIALEELLTALNVNRFILAKGKRRSISLHQRIENLPAKYSDFKEMILAIKWLGNAGSHSHHEITTDDVLNAYELLEHVLNEIYQSKTKRLVAITKKINKNKGPR